MWRLFLEKINFINHFNCPISGISRFDYEALAVPGPSRESKLLYVSCHIVNMSGTQGHLTTYKLVIEGMYVYLLYIHSRNFEPVVVAAAAVFTGI